MDFDYRYRFLCGRLGSHTRCLPSNDCPSHRVLALTKLEERQRRRRPGFFKTLCYFTVVEIGHTAHYRRWTPIILVGLAILSLVVADHCSSELTVPSKRRGMSRGEAL